MNEVLRQIHITPARMGMFEKEPYLYRDLLFYVLSDVPIEIQNGIDGEHILVKERLSEEKESRLQEIWEATMPPVRR